MLSCIKISRKLFLLLSNFSLLISAVLGRLPGTTVYRNIKQYPESYRYPGIVLIRIDAPMYFANISFIKDGYVLHYNKKSRKIEM
jgi:MFS superfamily sulfate permease-like transporter